MSGLLRRIKKIEEQLQAPALEYGILEHLIAWLDLPEEKRARTRKPKLTRELLDALIERRPWFINPAELVPYVDEEGNETYPPPRDPDIERPPVPVMGVYSCSSLLEKRNMTIYDLVRLLAPDDGIQFFNDYIGIPRRDNPLEQNNELNMDSMSSRRGFNERLEAENRKD